ncbi:MAG: phenylacetate--CoA ligase, partial [Candidatus Methanoplasma sp.]|nr:phenylacetate--CoA ligase [Candidatus Methanoplasma sp.]
MYWNQEIECMPKGNLKELQYRSLRTLTDKLYNFNQFYRNRMKAADVRPDDIRSLEDIAKLPFM